MMAFKYPLRLCSPPPSNACWQRPPNISWLARTSSRVRERTGQLSGAVQVQDHTAVAVESGAGSLEGEPIRCVDGPSSKFLPRTPVSVGQMVIVFELDADEKEPRWMKCRYREVESRASGTLRPNVDVGLKAPPKASVAPAATGRIRMDGLVPPVR